MQGTHRSRYCLVILTVLVVIPGVTNARTAADGQPDPTLERRVQELGPRLDTYVAGGMKDFDVPGVAIGIVAGDKLVYSKGWGVRTKGGSPVGSSTIFQIGSTTKAFLATTMAIAVDHGKLSWDSRVIDLDPDFQLYDPWVTREFRVSGKLVLPK